MNCLNVKEKKQEDNMKYEQKVKEMWKAKKEFVVA